MPINRPPDESTDSPLVGPIIRKVAAAPKDARDDYRFSHTVPPHGHLVYVNGHGKMEVRPPPVWAAM